MARRGPISSLVQFATRRFHVSRSHFAQSVENRGRLEPLRIVGIDVSELHNAASIEHERARHWKLPGLITIELRNRATECGLQCLQRVAEHENEAVPARDVIVRVGQHREVELLLLGIGGRVVGGLRGDSDELSA